MILQTKPASVRHFKIRYSKLILKFEITFIVVLFLSLFMVRNELWFLPVLVLYCLITFIYFSLFSINKRFPEKLVFEFRTAPERLIWYDSAGESSFLLQDVDIRMTRWFVMLKLVNSSSQWCGVVLQDSFDNMNHYTSFRRQLLLKKRDEDTC